MTPFLGWFNLLELLTELKETFYLLEHQLMIKHYNSGTPDRREDTGVHAPQLQSLCAATQAQRRQINT